MMSSLNLNRVGHSSEKPTLENKVHFTYGPLGPDRPAQFVIGEWITATLKISGISLDDDGNTNISVKVEVRNSDDRLVGQLPIGRVKNRLPLGGGVFTQSFTLPATTGFAHGTYHLIVVTTDHISGDTNTIDVPFALFPPDAFAVSKLYLASDTNGTNPVGACFSAGETVFLHASISGFETNEGKHKIESKLTVLDDKGSAIGPSIVHPVIENSNSRYSDADPNAKYPLSYHLLLNRPGRYILKCNVKDVLGQNTVSHQLLIRVIDEM